MSNSLIDIKQVRGLSGSEVAERVLRGQVNKQPDSVSPTKAWIIFRNVFNLINIFLIPLFIVLLSFEKYKELFVISTFAIVNSAVSAWDEIRIKKRLDQIRISYAPKVNVIRDGELVSIPVEGLVEDDVVYLSEGEPVPSDGELLATYSVLIDESLLTGESDYIPKSKGEHVIGGSFVVVGEAVYRVSGISNGSYVNSLTQEARKFQRQKTNLQKIGDKLVIFFITASLLLGGLTFFSARSLGYSIEDSVIPLVTVVALIVPQTLIFLFTFSLSIAVVKLSAKGALVQRSAAIETLASLDVLCLDKTGTITSNQMEIVNTKYWHLDAEDLARIFNYSKNLVVGKNKTFYALEEYFKDFSALAGDDFEQIPFTSRTKYARNQFRSEERGEYVQLVYGARSEISRYVSSELLKDVEEFIAEEEEKGRRVIIGVVNTSREKKNLEEQFLASQVWAVSLLEELNPSIANTLTEFSKLGTRIKIISGDSKTSVGRILGRMNVDMGRTLDLSTFVGNLSAQVEDYDVFVRSKPEHKLEIITALQKKGFKVGMVGDGVNDVLAMKTANLSIAMESGARITQDVADIVLLNNDFGLVPTILFEGQNVVFNLKFINKVFLTKTFQAILFTIGCAVSGLIFPLLPTTILVYSFFSTSLPSYIIAFYRRSVKNIGDFMSDVMPPAVLSALVATAVSMYTYFQFRDRPFLMIDTAIMYSLFLYTTWYAVYEMWRAGYLRKWYEVILSALIISLIGIGATWFTFIRNYYDLDAPTNDDWRMLIQTALIGFMAYVFISAFSNIVWKNLRIIRSKNIATKE